MASRRCNIGVVSAFLFAGLLAGCGGGGGGAPTSLPITVTPNPGLPGPKAAATIAVKLPNYFKPSKQLAKRFAKLSKPLNIPPTAMSIRFTVNGMVASTVNLNSNQSLYFITIPLPLGTDTIVADLFDGKDAGGNKIATTVPPVTVTIVANATNTVNITLSGIATQVCPAPNDQMVLTGTSGTMNFAFFPVDADGNFLSPPYTPSFTVGVTGASPLPLHISLGTTMITSPAENTSLSWDTKARGLATAVSNLPIVSFCGEKVTFGGPYGYVSNFGEGTVSVFDQAQANLRNGSTQVQNFDMQGNLTQPVGIVFDAHTAPFKVFIADFAQNHIVVMDASTNTFRNAIDTHGLHPWGLSLSPDGRFLYATESGTSDQVEIFDTATESSVVQVSGIDPGSFPTGISTFDPATAGVQTLIAERFAARPTVRFLTNQNSTLDPNPVASSQPSGPVFAIAHSPVGTGVKGTALLREIGSPGMDTLDLGPSPGFYTSIAGTLADQFVIAPNAIAVSPGAGSTAWAVGSSNALYKITFSPGNGWGLVSCTALIGTTCGQSGTMYPVGAAYSDDGTVLYVLDYGAVPGTNGQGAASIVDPAGPRRLFDIFLGRNPIAIAIGTLPAGATPFNRRPAAHPRPL
ncbi:MAG: hypothetical protein DLM50_03890 [Candidatus Meridianibacter frigidus]|nr:MAG: hypothetical protein DLM50_03890 [Candidatus Eremiobacteraeota bacterium]